MDRNQPHNKPSKSIPPPIPSVRDTYPIFMLAKCLRRCLIEKPFYLSGLARLAGFIYGYVTREERSIPADARQFVREEQKKRLLAYAKFGRRPCNPIKTDNSV